MNINGIIAIALLTFGAWYSVYECRKRKKFYDKYAEELSGEVVTWSKHLGYNGRYKQTYYVLDVLAENGETYHISTFDIGNTTQSTPDGFVRNLLAYFPSSCTEIP